MSSPKHRHGRHRKPGKAKQYAAYAGTTAAAGIIAAGLAAGPASASVTTPAAAGHEHMAMHQQHLAFLHWHHFRHLDHLAHLRGGERYSYAASSYNTTAEPAASSGYSSQGGNLSYSGLEALWEAAGGPAWAASSAATIAECESGGRQYAENPSGASGYFQILGQVVSGNVFDPMVNADNAVTKFRDAGDSFSPWVCQA